MKKFGLGFITLFFILGTLGGLINLVSGKSVDKLGDTIVFIICVCLSILFIYLFYKTYKNQNSPTTLKNNDDIQLKNENIRLNNKIREMQDELNNKYNSFSEKRNEEPYIVEKEIESKELLKEYKQLKDSNDNKDKLIKQLKHENDTLRKKLSRFEDEHLSNLLTNSNQKTNHSTVSNINTPELDLSYSKVRKIPATFVVLDFETTGLNHKENEIIQYGIVEFKDGNVINEFTKFFKPDQPVGKTVMRKTGITNEFLEDKPRISKEYMEELLLLLDGKTIVAHNAPFDMKFLLKNLHDFDIKHEKFRVFDTLTASRRLINETPNHKLETLKEYFNLDDGESHQALNDAKATGQLALLLIDRME